VIKLGGMRGAEHVECMELKDRRMQVSWGNLRERDNLEDLGTVW
jgi:hypothetical protein